MEEEGEFVRLDQATGSQELLNLIALFLNGSTPELEHRMAMYHPDQYLAILANRQQPRDVLVTCVSVFKQALSKRRNEFQYTFQTVLGSVEALFLSGSEDLCNLLEIVLETLFEEYLDDEKKL